MGMSSLVVKQTVLFSIQAANQPLGSDYQSTGNNTTISKIVQNGTSAANAAAGGSDEVYSAITSIPAASSVTLTLNSLTDFLGTTAVNLARIKNILIRLLSAVDDSVFPGTAASSVTIDGTVASAFLSTSGSGWLTNATSKFDIANGAFVCYGTPSAGGITTAGKTALKITNNDGTLAAAVQVSLGGGST